MHRPVSVIPHPMLTLIRNIEIPTAHSAHVPTSAPRMQVPKSAKKVNSILPCPKEMSPAGARL
jgi:hypothetical protein